jgi:putative FmdB family regulatory protein
MPFYEYECQACKFYTEVMQKISDAALTKCPSCGKRALKKLVSAPVFRLKGAGWYETDFKSDKETKRNLVGAEKEEPKSETKTDSKESKDKDSKSEAKPVKESSESKATEPKPSSGRGRAKAAAKSSRRSARASSKVTRKRRR